MVNSGLRSYVMRTQSPGAQAFRSGWSLNSCTYAAMRGFLAELKAAGILEPTQPALEHAGSKSLAFAGECQAWCLVLQCVLTDTREMHAGMANILESAQNSRATVLRWGCSPDVQLLAWGCASGAVHVQQVDAEAGTKWVGFCHAATMHMCIQSLNADMCRTSAAISGR